ncbi:MAG: cytochrome c biogenesis protein CcdA [Actinomycetota bacterium]|nr:cytochrome c biogenesis protein CcdA [Actinomycetota bacterium]
MDAGSLAFALAAGLVAAFNPCGFAMLPAYLTLAVRGERSQGSGSSAGSGAGSGRGSARPDRAVALGRALGATAAMTGGFLLVFGVFGLLVAPLATAVQEHLPWVTALIGLGLVGLGGWLLAGRELTVLLPRTGRGAPTARLGSMFGYGIAYAMASLSCTIAPFIGVTAAAFRSGSVLAGVAVFLAYGLGMALVVGVLAVAVALVGAGLAARARKLLPLVNRLSGALLVLVGLYVGYYGVFELRLASGGDPDDPVIGAAGVIQQRLADWVAGVGAVGLLGILVALAAVVLGGTLLARRRRRVDPRLPETGT